MVAPWTAISEARNEAEDAMIQLRAVTDVFAELGQLAGREAPAWVGVVDSLVHRTESAVYAYMHAVHAHAKPLLEQAEGGDVAAIGGGG